MGVIAQHGRGNKHTIGLPNMTTIPIGFRFHRLVVIGYEGRRLKMQCDCGTAPKLVDKHKLLNGNTRSCGCIRGMTRLEWSPGRKAQLKSLVERGEPHEVIRTVMGLSQETLKNRINMYGFNRTPARVSFPKPKDTWPPGIRFEDVSPGLCARDVRGPKPQRQHTYSLTGNSSALCTR